MSQRIVQVDAFADRPFVGNPAAVCLLDRPTDPAWMQAVAREMNLAETAFLVPEGPGFHLRWFTPVIEVDLCGHATLAAAHVLWEDGHLPPDRAATFRTRSGTLIARHRGDRIELDFPGIPIDRPADPGPIEAALGVPVLFAGLSRFDALAEVESEAVVRALDPDMGRIGALDVRGLIVTARSASPGSDFVSRFFAPRCGVPEDPVTGSAHCVLGPFWASKLGRDDLVGYQASPRGGVVRVRVAGDRVVLGGGAVTVLRGDLLSDPPAATSAD